MFVVSHPSLKKSEGWGTRPLWANQRVSHPPLRVGVRMTSEEVRYGLAFALVVGGCMLVDIT